MVDNPIKQICADYFAAGRSVRDIRPGNRVALKKEVMIVFRDGSQQAHEIETQDRDELLRWSKEATVYVTEQAV